MSAITVCPHCQAEHSVNANRAGQRLRCPACDQLFDIVIGRPEPVSEPSSAIDSEEDVVELEPAMAAPAAPTPAIPPQTATWVNPPLAPPVAAAN